MNKALVKNFCKRIPSGSFKVIYWDGGTEEYGSGEPTFSLIFHEPIPFQRIIRDPILAFGEAYMEGSVELSGDMTDIIEFAKINSNIFEKKTNPVLKVLKFLFKANSLQKQKKDVQYHYDLSNEFYSLWLDETMSYSCAYFHNAEESLTKAQINKIDLVLKKLQLKPGETLLDIGSGWGWLIIKAARDYGAKAMGITLSREQWEKTNRRIDEYSLHSQVQVELMDYRDLAESGYSFDKIVSVGMLEHVGQANYPIFMKSIQKLLKEGGLSLLHSITGTNEHPVNSWIEKYIFPGGYIPSLRELIWLLPEYDFHVIDIENLRMHYAMTLDHWVNEFEKHTDKIQKMFDERFVRMWRLYLQACAASFRVSGLNIHQILFSKGLNNDLPLTRQHLYI